MEGHMPNDIIKADWEERLFAFKARVGYTRVSLIIPTYNMAKYLPESIESVLAQKKKPFEIIIVDDGSTDNTKEVVKKYLSDKPTKIHPMVQYIYQNHGGLAKALNTGIRISTGQFFLALGADDKLMPQYIWKCLACLFLCGEKCGFVWTATQEFGVRDRVKIPRKMHHRFSPLRGTGGQLGAALIRRKAFDTVHEYDESLEAYEDWDMIIRMCRKGWKGFPIFEPLHFQRIHEQQLTYGVEKTKLYYKKLRAKHPIMKIYVPISRAYDAIKLTLLHPKIAFNRFLQKLGRR